MARRRRNPMRSYFIFSIFAVAGLAWWMGWFSSGEKETQVADTASNSDVLLIAEGADDIMKPPTESMPVGTTDSLDSTPRPANAPSAVKEAESIRLLKKGQKALEQGNTIEARSLIGKAYTQGLPSHLREGARSNLNTIGETTIFSSRALKGDDLVEFYTIKSGDSLAKIAKTYKVTPELIANINGIQNMNRIRAGQRIKVVKGPFHAKVSKTTFEMDIMLGNTLVKTFQVGLGQDDGTPLGEWKIKNKLKNPTYYPPRGGKIIAADDPANPLGERWLGLEGVSGEALGQQRYGIHGTIEPDSIGKAVSMGCVRMLNKDVTQVYDLLIANGSRVFIVE